MKTKPWLFWCGLLFLGAGLTAIAGGVITNCDEVELQAAVAGGGTVTFSGDCSITLTHAFYIGAGTTVINAAGHKVTLSGANKVSLFNVDGNLTLSGLTIANGRGTYGGAMYISPSGTVLATNCSFVGNAALGTNGTAGVTGANSSSVGGGGSSGGSGTSAIGGAIYNAGVLTLWTCTLATNTVTAGDGGAGGNGGTGSGALGEGGDGGSGGNGATAWGGAVYNGANLTAIDSTFTGNTVKAGKGGAGGAGGSASFPGRPGNGGYGGAAAGAGVYNAKYIVLRGCTFSGNTSVAGHSAAAGTMSNDSGAPGPGGGQAFGAGLATTLWGVATNCTFFDEMAIGGDGGNGGDGMDALAQAGDGGNGGDALGGAVYNPGTFTMVNCTIANCAAVGGTNGVGGNANFAGKPGSVGQALGGGLANRGTFRLHNTLLSTNSPGGSGNGTFIDFGHNLSSDGNITFGGGSYAWTNPKIGTLAANGGPTLTIALLTGSPAINAAGSDPANFPATDQRGVRRPQGVAADIGAFELVTSATIFTQPRDQMVPYGGTATFTASSLGASPHYQWRFNGSPVSSATASSYTISNVTQTNAGTYDVVVTNIYGSDVSQPATLFVGPHISTGPTNQEVALGNPATFAVAADGSTPLVYQWSYNGTNVSGATDATYTLANAQTNNDGTYQVVITNVAGSVTSAPAVLTVDAILVQPVSQTVATGSNVVLSVTATGSSLKYQWRLNGTNNLLSAIAPTYSFIANKSDAGVYDVLVYNTLVSMRSAPATITVLDPPVFTNPPPASMVVTQGQAVTFSAGASGDSLAYQWFFQGNALPGATGSSYTIPAAGPADSGTYRVVATNTAASSSSSTLLRVLAPTSFTQASLSSNVFNISFLTQTNFLYVLQYKNTLADANWSSLKTNTGNGGLILNQDPATNQPGRFYRLLIR